MDDILEYFGAVDYHKSKEKMEETSSWKDILGELVNEMNSAAGTSVCEHYFQNF